MQRLQVDLAVKRRLKRVWLSILFFYAKYSANILRASVLHVGGGKLPPPAPTPLVGPSNLQILATPLGQTRGGALQSVQILILAEGQKIEVFRALSRRESSLVQTFWESYVHLDITHPSVHMTQRFVNQCYPTLIKRVIISHNYACMLMKMDRQTHKLN